MDFSDYLRFVLALAMVLAMIGGLAALARRFGFGGVQRNTTGRRLGMIEVLPIDGRRKLLLVRRDGVEHLLLLGASGETVIETGIDPGKDAALPSMAPHESETSTAIGRRIATLGLAFPKGHPAADGGRP